MKSVQDKAQAPAPLVDASVDLKGFSGFILDVEALLASELMALATPEEIAAALMLWCRAWQQVPHGSLPNDERVLAAFSRSKNWKKVQDMALRGFVLCSDGRLYHRTLCKKVLEAWEQRQAYARRREKDADRLRDWRGRKPGVRGAALLAEGDVGELGGDGETRFVAGVTAVSTSVSTPASIPASTPASTPLRREVMGSEENLSVPDGTGPVGAGSASPGLSASLASAASADSAASFGASASSASFVSFAESGHAGRGTAGIDGGDAEGIDVHGSANAGAGPHGAPCADGITLLPAELPRQQLWQAGKALLAQAGVAPRQCGSVIGKLVSQYGEHAVTDAVRAAIAAQPAAPVEYLVAACRRAVGARAGNRQDALEARNRAVAEKLAQETV